MLEELLQGRLAMLLVFADMRDEEGHARVGGECLSVGDEVFRRVQQKLEVGREHERGHLGGRDTSGCADAVLSKTVDDSCEGVVVPHHQ